MFERFKEHRANIKAKQVEQQAMAEAARITALSSAILKAMSPKDAAFIAVRVEGSRTDDAATMIQIGKILLEKGVKARIGETCEGFNSVGTAIDRHLKVIPLGQKLPQHWNGIFPPEDDVEGTTSFTLLDNIPGKEYVPPTGAAAFASLDPNAITAVWKSTLL